MKPKKIITIQYSVLAILSFIVFFLPFIKYELSIPALHQTLDVISFNGIRLLSAFFADPAEYIKIDELLPLFYDLKKYFSGVCALCADSLAGGVGNPAFVPFEERENAMVAGGFPVTVNPKYGRRMVWCKPGIAGCDK